jgi:hypothetical protein
MSEQGGAALAEHSSVRCSSWRRRWRKPFGCVGVVVDAKPDAVPFYEKLGFVALEIVAGEVGDRPMPLPMYLELAQVPAAT